VATLLAESTLENWGVPAGLEVVGLEIGQQVQTDDQSFYGVSGTPRTGGRRMDHVCEGSSRTLDSKRHGYPPRVWPLRSRIGTRCTQWTRTLLELSRPEDYALQPLPPT